MILSWPHLNREEAENATELQVDVSMPNASTGPGLGGMDALNVQGHRLNKSIRTFDDA